MKQLSSKGKLAYLAGFLDGEGHFYLPFTKNGRGESYYQFRIVAAQSTKTVLEWIKLNFGGCVTKLYDKRGEEPKESYHWVFCGKKARELALELKPYLIVKREQLENVLSKESNVG